MPTGLLIGQALAFGPPYGIGGAGAVVEIALWVSEIEPITVVLRMLRGTVPIIFPFVQLTKVADSRNDNNGQASAFADGGQEDIPAFPGALCEVRGVRQYGNDGRMELRRDGESGGRLVLRIYMECETTGVDLDLWDLIDWLETGPGSELVLGPGASRARGFGVDRSGGSEGA